MAGIVMDMINGLGGQMIPGFLTLFLVLTCCIIFPMAEKAGKRAGPSFRGNRN